MTKYPARERAPLFDAEVDEEAGRGMSMTRGRAAVGDERGDERGAAGDEGVSAGGVCECERMTVAVCEWLGGGELNGNGD